MEQHGLEWSAFVAQLPALLARTARDKRNMPALLTAAFDDGYRSNDTVGDHAALVIDVDDAGADPVAFVRRCLRKVRCAVYESPSSTDEAPRFRVIAALPAPYPAHAVPAARAALARALKLDPAKSGVSKAAAPAQIFFAGTLEGTRKRAVWVSSDTAPVWTPPAPGVAPERAERRTATAPTSPVHAVDRIPDLSAAADAVEPDPDDATEQRRGGREAMRALGGVLARLGYDPAAIGIAVAEQIPSSQPDERAAQAADAAEAYYAGEERTAGAESLERTLGADVVEALREANGDGAWEARAAATWDAPSHEPTPVELESDHPTVDGSGLQLCGGTGWPWIVQFGTQFWLHDVANRAYLSRAYGSSELANALSNNLRSVIPDEDRTPAELSRVWIAVANEARWSYMARTCTYDPARRVLAVPALRWATLRAQRHAGVDTWLRALAGDGYARLAQWLASVVQLDRPAPCLYMIGGPKIGKTLLADGLAALWGQAAPCKMLDATSQFNDGLGSCPLVFSDEGFPPDFDFARFREAITGRSRDVNRKYGAKGSVEGCVRYVLAANNDEALRYQRVGSLRKGDISAIADRLLVLHCSDDAADAVSALDTAWVARQGLAEHALWLAETVALEPTSQRMCAKPHGAEDLLAKVIEGRVADGQADVLLKIDEALGAGELGEAYGVWVKGGLVHIRASLLLKALREDGMRVKLRDVWDACALAQLGEPERTRIGGRLMRVRTLNLAALRAAIAGLD